MKNYSLHIVNDDDGNLFHCIFEEQTQQVYDFYYFLDDAKECIDFLENGGAFNGFTPAFILNEINIKESGSDLNQKVNTLFSD